MTKRLEEVFNLPVTEEQKSSPVVPVSEQIAELRRELTNSEKIDSALEEVRGMEHHDEEMDEISREALDSYKDLMELGLNVTDMAAGPIFTNAAQMLKIALEARDAKVTRKLKQVDMMLKKARLDKMADHSKDGSDGEDESGTPGQFDRNQMIEMIRAATGTKSR